jgi:hypothetical protein
MNRSISPKWSVLGKVWASGTATEFLKLDWKNHTQWALWAEISRLFRFISGFRPSNPLPLLTYPLIAMSLCSDCNLAVPSPTLLESFLPLAEYRNDSRAVPSCDPQASRYRSDRRLAAPKCGGNEYVIVTFRAKLISRTDENGL